MSHMARQLSCRDTCDIMTWSHLTFLEKATCICTRFGLWALHPFVKQAPDRSDKSQNTEQVKHVKTCWNKWMAWYDGCMEFCFLDTINFCYVHFLVFSWCLSIFFTNIERKFVDQITSEYLYWTEDLTWGKTSTGQACCTNTCRNGERFELAASRIFF